MQELVNAALSKIKYKQEGLTTNAAKYSINRLKGEHKNDPDAFQAAADSVLEQNAGKLGAGEEELKALIKSSYSSLKNLVEVAQHSKVVSALRALITKVRNAPVTSIESAQN